MNDIIGVAISGISCIVCLAIWTIPKLYYGYKTESIKESEETTRESIKLAQKVAEKDKEAEKTKQLQIKAEYKEKYGETLYNV